jgi:hypothetical protein
VPPRISGDKQKLEDLPREVQEFKQTVQYLKDGNKDDPARKKAQFSGGAVAEQVARWAPVGRNSAR